MTESKCFLDLNQEETVFFLLGLLNDKTDLPLATLLFESISADRLTAIMKYKLTGINPKDLLLPAGLKCFIDISNLRYVGSGKDSKDYNQPELLIGTFLPVTVDEDLDFSSKYVRIILPTLPGEEESVKCLVDRTAIILEKDVDLPYNQTSESEEELV